jgi:cyclophilin family peptidyl-prolyl cis-trans isomerase
MIQGGDPTGQGTGSGPRMIKLEPSQKQHVRGVLSMARSNDPNSASCQFFIMHGANPGLDGKYSAFGEVVTGMDTVDKIATTPKNRNGNELSSPIQPQVIERALVVLAPDAPQGK